MHVATELITYSEPELIILYALGIRIPDQTTNNLLTESGTVPYVLQSCTQMNGAEQER